MARIHQTLPPDKASREIGHLAVWSVTSAKPGNGVDLLRDGRDDTYWQSDGVQPHYITLQFQKKVLLAGIALQTDYKLDESYTPQRVSVRAGSCWSDMREIKTVELIEPQGWVVISLLHETTNQPHMKAFIVQVAIIANHQNGRDTHIRQLRVYGPRADPNKLDVHDVSFTTPDFQMYTSVR